MKDSPLNITKAEGVIKVRNLFKPFIAQSETDDLFNGTLIPRKTRPVALSGAGVIKRGTPLTSEDGQTFKVWAPSTTDAESGETVCQPIVGILLFDVDTEETEEAENACLCISGEFNQNKIEEALGGELEAYAVMEAWGKQIHIEPSYEYPEAEMFPLG